MMVEDVNSQAAPQVGEPEPKHSVLAGGISVIGALAVPAVRLAAQISPIPGLGLAATLVENIFVIVEKLRYNKAQCRRLAESARDVVDAVNRAAHPSNPEDIDDGLKQNVENLICILERIEDRLNILVDMKFLKRLVQSSQIEEDLASLDSECQHAARVFMIRAVVDLQANQHKNELARKADMRALLDEVTRLSQSPDDVAERVGLNGTQLDGESVEGMQTLLHQVDTNPTISPEIRTFAEVATRTIKSRTNYEFPRELPWVVKASDVEKLEKIGSGGFSVVHKGYWKSRQHQVAIKYLHDQDSGNIKLIDEVSTWKNLSHSNLHKFLGAAPLENPAFIISSYCQNGNAIDYITIHPETDRFRILHDVSLGMKYLHECGITHGDLKAHNVLITDDGTAVVADFGVAKYQRHFDSPLSSLADIADGISDSPKVVLTGTRRWLAPECFLDGIVTQATDVWAMGMLAYELFTNGRVPFVDIADEELGRLLQDGLRPEFPAGQPDADLGWLMMIQCWKYPEPRPSFDNLSAFLGLLAASALQEPYHFRGSWWPGFTEAAIVILKSCLNFKVVQDRPGFPLDATETSLPMALRLLESITRSLGPNSIDQDLTLGLPILEFLLQNKLELDVLTLEIGYKLVYNLTHFSYSTFRDLDSTLMQSLGFSGDLVDTQILRILEKLLCNGSHGYRPWRCLYYIQLGILPKLLDVFSRPADDALIIHAIQLLGALIYQPAKLTAMDFETLVTCLLGLCAEKDGSVQACAIKTFGRLLCCGAEVTQHLKDFNVLSKLIGGWKESARFVEVWFPHWQSDLDPQSVPLSRIGDLITPETVPMLMELLGWNSDLFYPDQDFAWEFLEVIMKSINKDINKQSRYIWKGVAEPLNPDTMKIHKLQLIYKIRLVSSGCLPRLLPFLRITARPRMIDTICKFILFIGCNPTALTGPDLKAVTSALAAAFSLGGYMSLRTIQTLNELAKVPDQQQQIRAVGVMPLFLPHWRTMIRHDDTPRPNNVSWSFRAPWSVNEPSLDDASWPDWVRPAGEFILNIATEDDIGGLSNLIHPNVFLNEFALCAIVKLGASIPMARRRQIAELNDLNSRLSLFGGNGLKTHNAFFHVYHETSAIPSLVDQFRLQNDDDSRAQTMMKIYLVINDGWQRDKMVALSCGLLDILRTSLQPGNINKTEKSPGIHHIASEILPRLFEVSDDCLGVVINACIDAGLHISFVEWISHDRETARGASGFQQNCFIMLRKMAYGGSHIRSALIQTPLLPLLHDIFTKTFESKNEFHDRIHDAKLSCFVIEGLLDDDDTIGEIVSALAAVGLIDSLVECVKQGSCGDHNGYSRTLSNCAINCLHRLILSPEVDLLDKLREDDGAISTLKYRCKDTEQVHCLFEQQAHLIVQFLQHPAVEVQELGILTVRALFLRTPFLQRRALMKTPGLRSAMEELANSSSSIILKMETLELLGATLSSDGYKIHPFEFLTRATDSK